MAKHERLREILRCLELCCRGRRSENREARIAKRINNSVGERTLGADDGQSDTLGPGEKNQFRNRRDCDIRAASFACRSGVTRRDEDFLHPLRLRQLPGQRVLSRAAADDQDFHRGAVSKTRISQTRTGRCRCSRRH